VHDALRVIRESDVTRLGSVDRAFRGDLETIADKALSNDKQRRYQSAASLAADLRRFLADEPIAARPPSTLYQLRKFARRNKALVTGVAAGLLLLMGGTALAVWQAVVATHAKAVAERAGDMAGKRAAEATRQAYRATIAAAAAALEAHDPRTARQRLMDIAEPLRNWEWRYLHAQLDHSVALFTTASGVVGVGPAADGQHLLIVSRNGVVQETDIATGQVARSLQLDVNPIVHAVVSADGLHIALAWDARRGCVGIADVNGTGAVRTLGEAGRTLLSLAIAPDGNRIASIHPEKLALWDCAGDAQPRIVDAGCWSGSVTFSRDGNRVALGCAGVFRMFDAATGTVVAGRTVLNNGPGVDLSTDAAQIITGGADKKVHVINMQTGNVIESYAGHLGAVYDVALSPDQSQVASVSADGTLRIWRRGEAEPIAILNMPTDSTRSVQFLHDGSTVLTRDSDGAARLWRADAGRSDVLTGHQSYVYGLAFTPDGSRLVSGAWDRTLRVWDVASRACIRVLDPGKISDPYVTSVAISRDGTTLAAGYHRGGGMSTHVRLWNLDTGAITTTLRPQIGEVRALAFSPDGSLLVSGRTHVPLTLWNMRDREAPPELLKDVGVAISAAWSHDGRLIATSHEDRTIRIWDSASRHMLREMKGHSALARSCQFSPDDRLLASAANDVRLWDVATGECRAVLDRHWDEVMAVAFSPDGTRLATGSRDTTVRIWDVEFGEEVAQLRGHSDYVYALAFSPDGTVLASASGDTTVRLWDTVPIRARRTNHPVAESQP
jgi:Tol biopolymer transport system component